MAVVVSMTIISLKARAGSNFAHEKPILRKPKGELPGSARGDGTTHFFEVKKWGIIKRKGPDVREKAEMFTNGCIQYVQEFYTFMS